MKDDWKRYFRDIILKRGAAYALSECVSDLKKDDLGWTAVVHGSEDYDVEIEMEDDEILYMSCTCPYADGDHYCKHMAAVLYEIERMSGPGASAQEPAVDWTDPGSIQKSFRSRMEHLVSVYGGRDYFIDWEAGPLYVIDFIDTLRLYLSNVMESEDYSLAHALLKDSIVILNGVDMDGSNGEHSDIGEVIEEYWMEIIPELQEKEKSAAFAWFRKSLENSIFDSMVSVLEEVYLYAFNEPCYLNALLKETLEDLEEETSSYRLSILLEQYEDLLIRSGKDLTEKEQWLETHRHSPAVLSYLADKAEKEENYTALVPLLEELMKMDELNVWTRTKTSTANRLAEAYMHLGFDAKEKAILEDILLIYNSTDMKKIRRLKALSSQEEWGEIREAYFRNHQSTIPEILAEDKLWDRLIAILPRYHISVTDRYQEQLREEYPSQLIDIYSRYLVLLSGKHAGTTVYSEMTKYLLSLARIPGGASIAITFIDDWTARFPGRKKMIETLQKVRSHIQKMMNIQSGSQQNTFFPDGAR
ncbi:MAG: SWIM zinc finger family protein [Oscillospiraceae bacterium]|nr:SWIM zinc finger family protein [Oscillospiraceae bacterium]